MSGKKQAVVLIHGMGEQKPMASIRKFVNGVWKKDESIPNPRFWSKPSSVHESFEQRRLTTGSDDTRTKPRTDFYEYYWAHQTQSTQWAHFVDWFSSIILRNPALYYRHPNRIVGLWLVLVAITVCILVANVAYFDDWTVVFGLSAVVLFVASKFKFFATSYFGDVARYVRAKPENIRIRQDIREGGIDLLERLHDTGDYERIIIVGHSLGSIIAYDVLNHLWSRRNKLKVGNVPTPLSDTAQCLSEQLSELSLLVGTKGFNQKEYRHTQQALFEELRASSQNSWLVSDFVTLGSPLTYADFLLFSNTSEFDLRKRDREYPLSPPIMEKGRFFYREGKDYFLHHGAVFAPVKWTNIYCPHQALVFGDIISGPVSFNFSHKPDKNGETVVPPECIHYTPIKEVVIDWRDVKTGFCHTEYWSYKEKKDNIHLTKLREALCL